MFGHLLCLFQDVTFYGTFHRPQQEVDSLLPWDQTSPKNFKISECHNTLCFDVLDASYKVQERIQ